MKTMTSLESSILQNCINFKASYNNMKFEDRVSLFTQVLMGHYFDFTKPDFRKTYEVIFHKIFTFDMRDVLSFSPEKVEEFKRGSFDMDDVVFAFLIPLLERQPLDDIMVSQLYQYQTKYFMEYAFLISSFVSIPFSIIKEILPKLVDSDREIIFKSQRFTEDEFDIVKEYCTEFHNYSEYIESYTLNKTSTVSI